MRHLAAVETLGLGHRHRVRQDRHADEERDDRARGRHRERARDVRRHGLRAARARCGATAAAPIDGALRAELERALAVADRANNAVVQERDGRWTVQGDPTEGALLVAARKAGLELGRARRALPRVGEVPFSSERKLMSTVHRDAEQQDARHRVHQGRARRAAGALHARARRRGRAAADARRAAPRSCEANEALAGEALRTLGVAGRWLPERRARGARRRVRTSASSRTSCSPG